MTTHAGPVLAPVGPVLSDGPLRDELLLALWERGIACETWARADALLSASGDEGPRTLGQRTRALLRLHASLFGGDADLLSHCPSCRTPAQFSVNCATLLEHLPSAADAVTHRLELQGFTLEFRLPAAPDIAAASSEETDDAFARRVLERCVLACTRGGVPAPLSGVPDDVLDAVSKQMETLDPGATLSFAVRCPECGAQWDAPLDTGQLVWQKVQAAAERLFLDIDALARAYGWTEQQVLSLPPVRRAAYLQIVSA
jgi:hypothetical protein